MEIVGLLVISAALTLVLLAHERRQRRFKAEAREVFSVTVHACLNRLESVEALARQIEKRVLGQFDKLKIETKLAEKCAERAMSLASGANVATIAIQRSLYSGRRFPSKEVQQRDTLARKKVKDILGESEWEYLRPLLNEEELDVLEKAMEHKEKFDGTGN